MKVYSFLDNALIISGNEITGWDEGDDTIKCARRNNSANSKVGTGGEMTVSISADHSGIVTFRLMQNSDSNKYMSGLLNAQENGAFVPLFLQLKNVSNEDLVTGTLGYIEKPADMNRGQNANSQEWILVFENLIMLPLGAN